MVNIVVSSILILVLGFLGLIPSGAHDRRCVEVILGRPDVTIIDFDGGLSPSTRTCAYSAYRLAIVYDAKTNKIAGISRIIAHPRKTSR